MLCLLLVLVLAMQLLEMLRIRMAGIKSPGQGQLQ
jgi:hypothetical protein